MSAQQRWEYLVVQVAAFDQDDLNDFGHDGWELVSIRSAGSNDQLVFKREAHR